MNKPVHFIYRVVSMIHCFNTPRSLEIKCQSYFLFYFEYVIVYMHFMFDGKVFQQITYIPVGESFPSSFVYYFHMKGNLFR